MTKKVREGLTSDVNRLQGKGLLLIMNQSSLFSLVSHCWQWLCWARVWAVWTSYTHEKKMISPYYYYSDTIYTYKH